jgi:hypothetical protein
MAAILAIGLLPCGQGGRGVTTVDVMVMFSTHSDMNPSIAKDSLSLPDETGIAPT